MVEVGKRVIKKFIQPLFNKLASSGDNKKNGGDAYHDFFVTDKMNDDFSIARTNYFIDFKNELILNILKDKELPVSKDEYIKIMGYIEGENKKHTLTQFNNYETLNKVIHYLYNLQDKLSDNDSNHENSIVFDMLNKIFDNNSKNNNKKSIEMSEQDLKDIGISIITPERGPIIIKKDVSDQIIIPQIKSYFDDDVKKTEPTINEFLKHLINEKIKICNSIYYSVINVRKQKANNSNEQTYLENAMKGILTDELYRDITYEQFVVEYSYYIPYFFGHYKHIILDYLMKKFTRNNVLNEKDVFGELKLLSGCLKLILDDLNTKQPNDIFIKQLNKDYQGYSKAFNLLVDIYEMIVNKNSSKEKIKILITHLPELFALSGLTAGILTAFVIYSTEEAILSVFNFGGTTLSSITHFCNDNLSIGIRNIIQSNYNFDLRSILDKGRKYSNTGSEYLKTYSDQIQHEYKVLLSKLHKQLFNNEDDTAEYNTYQRIQTELVNKDNRKTPVITFTKNKPLYTLQIIDIQIKRTKIYTVVLMKFLNYFITYTTTHINGKKRYETINTLVKQIISHKDKRKDIGLARIIENYDKLLTGNENESVVNFITHFVLYIINCEMNKNFHGEDDISSLLKNTGNNNVNDWINFVTNGLVSLGWFASKFNTASAVVSGFNTSAYWIMVSPIVLPTTGVIGFIVGISSIIAGATNFINSILPITTIASNLSSGNYLGVIQIIPKFMKSYIFNAWRYFNQEDKTKFNNGIEVLNKHYSKVIHQAHLNERKGGAKQTKRRRGGAKQTKRRRVGAKQSRKRKGGAKRTKCSKI
jgi:hypothetical protein